MSDTIDLAWIGAELRKVQAEQRSLRAEQGIMRQQLGDAISALLMRIGQSEALLMTRFDLLNGRMDQTERSMEERLTRIEQLLRP